MPSRTTPPNLDDEHFPVITMAGFCQLLISRMAEATMNPNDVDFEDLAMGLIRLVSGWACERGVPVTSLFQAVKEGQRDYLAHDEPTISIPIASEN